MLLSALAVGGLLGVVMQRGRFCVTGMMRDVFLQRTGRGLVAFLIVIAVHAVGLATLTSLGVIAPDYRSFHPVAVVTGGFIFGLSIILAGGCASGTWYRSAEGLVGSWFALLFYGLSAAAMKFGALESFSGWMKQWDTGLTTIPQALGVSAWWFVIPFTLFTGWLAVRYLARDAANPKATLDLPLRKRPLHPYLAGVLIGLLGVIAWPLSAATGRNDGLASIPVATGVLTLPKQAAAPTKARPLGQGRYALDTLGAVCPFPLIEAKEAIAELEDGEKLVIDFDCTQATESIPQWAADNGHTVEDFAQNQNAGWQLTVVKHGARP
ncbi:YeeE/YedE thiosulfate transporter family protein [Corynebacterium sp. Marseille-P4321]|uniref:YeeE/YedE thiosulfate transporter family protein n=1 Tax=Corynebacterium sp. Marseille-P4321 TaxID=2736603 RepID=UPI00158C8126|nr:YeeE/YedE thiosulfate transporter family protein [Corynebacterium sp. Marseille-P4321]